MSKTERAISLLREGRFPEALSVIAKFRMGFTKDEKRTIEIANEVLNGHGKIYRSIGIDTESIISKAREIIREKYNVDVK